MFPLTLQSVHKVPPQKPTEAPTMDSTHTTITKSQHVLPKQDYQRISPMGGLNSHSDMGGGGAELGRPQVQVQST